MKTKFLKGLLALTCLAGGFSATGLTVVNATENTGDVEYSPIPEKGRTIYNWYRYSIGINNGQTATILGPDGNNGWFSTSNNMTGLFPYMDDGTFIISYSGATAGTNVTVQLYSRSQGKVVKSASLSGTSDNVTLKYYTKGGDDFRIRFVNKSGKNIVINTVHVETKN